MRIFYSCLFFLVCIVCAGCSVKNPARKPLMYQRSGFSYFGTVCSVVVYDEGLPPFAHARFEKCWKQIELLLKSLDSSFNPSDQKSDVSRFNAALPGVSVPISVFTAELFLLSQKMYRFTDGAFNPAVALLVDLYGFSPRFRSSQSLERPYDRQRNADGSFNPPESVYVKAFTDLADFSQVRLSGDKKNGYFLKKPALNKTIGQHTYSMHIDFGGIAKGFAADLAAGVLERFGYRYGYVLLGNSSIRFLQNPFKGEFAENAWDVAIENPLDSSRSFAFTGADSEGLSSSGIYRDFYRTEGSMFTHIVDPVTGLPSADSLMSATVIGGDAGVNDALTTALMAMSADKAISFMYNKLDNKRVFLIARRNNILSEYTTMETKDFRLETADFAEEVYKTDGNKMSAVD